MDGWMSWLVVWLVSQFVGWMDGIRKDYTKITEWISTKRCRLASVKHKLFTYMNECVCVNI